MSGKRVYYLVLSALFMAIALVLPFVTGQIPTIGSRLLPMHLPVLICGFVCGWPWGLAVGFVSPLLRSLIFGMPPMMPTAIAMAFELAAYGAVAGFLTSRLPARLPWYYVTLVVAMVLGRLVWGLVCVPLYGVASRAFSLQLFWAGGFVNAVPGILCQILLVPPIVRALKR